MRLGGIAVAAAMGVLAGAVLAAGCNAARAASAGSVRYFVSPRGDDAWSGTKPAADARRGDGPFATIQRAQQAVREMHRAQPETAVTVSLRGGTYRLAGALVFTPEDSGTTAAPVCYESYRGERARISGGRRITGWTATPQGRWQAQIPDAAAGRWDFQQLFVNGERRYRPRLPKGDKTFHIERETSRTAKNAGVGDDRFGFRPGDLSASWANPGDVEVLTFHVWTMSRLRIAGVDETSRVVTFTGPSTGGQHYRRLSAGQRFLVENVKEALGEPGEWYLDRPTGVITYIPMPGERLRDAEIVAPAADRLLSLEGDAAHGRFVENIRFHGITFEHTNSVTPPEGRHCPQAEADLPAAVEARGARGIVFDGCAIAHIGAWAAAWNDACGGIDLRGCRLEDLGAGGVRIGAMQAPGRPQDAPAGCRIENTIIAHGGRIHPAAVGVLITHANHCTLRRNTITDFTYTGVSVGWSWGYGPSLSHHNRIEGNLITRIGQGVLSDMGGIYTLGVSPGTVLEGNRIEDVDSYGYGGWGIYFDEGTSGVVARNNTVLRTKSACFHQHYGRENLVENNVFAFGRLEQIARSRAEGHESFSFTRNIVLYATGRLLGGQWGDGSFTMDRNIYWNTRRTPLDFAGMSLEQWRAKGHDTNSQVADPRFVDAARGDFRLRRGSPAARIGFRPIPPDSAGAGARPRRAAPAFVKPASSSASRPKTVVQ